ncbi:MAG: LEPR-XLL domain-containing protein, partial [Pirellulales bacterium]
MLGYLGRNFIDAILPTLQYFGGNMALSRRSRRRRTQQSLRRHRMRLESLEQRIVLNAAPVLDDTASPALLSIAE